MAEYRLQALLDLRRREEEAAQSAHADAARVLEDARAAAAQHAATVEGLRNRYERSRTRGLAPASSAADLHRHDLFLEHLRTELAHGRRALDAFRRGALARALEREEKARLAYGQSVRAREVVSKHAEQHLATVRAAQVRREDEQAEETAHAVHHKRPLDRPDR